MGQTDLTGTASCHTAHLALTLRDSQGATTHPMSAANTWHCVSLITSLWHSSLPIQLPAAGYCSGENRVLLTSGIVIFSVHTCKKAPVTRPERLSDLFIPPPAIPATADPNSAGISCTPSLARAAHCGVVQLKSVGLLEAVFSISSAKVPVNK